MGRSRHWIVAVALSLLSFTAPAAEPAFDCGKADGEVETLICADEALAALDRELDQVYRAAQAKARDHMPAGLRAEQRGWVKGRNECWKAAGQESFLTASWRVSGVRACVEGQYRLRISELGAVWQLAPARGPVLHVCGDSPADELVATFYETDPPTARIERGDRTALLWRIPGDSVTYEGPNVTLRPEGEALTVAWLDEQLRCRERQP